MSEADEIMVRMLEEYFRKKGTPLKWCEYCKDWMPANGEHRHVDTSSSKSTLRRLSRGKAWVKNMRVLRDP